MDGPYSVRGPRLSAANGSVLIWNNGSQSASASASAMMQDATAATTASAATENITQQCNNEYCVSNEDYVDMILAWLFPKPFEWFLIAIYFCVFLVGIVGNFLVSFAVWRNHSMRTVTNYFIVNLSVADFLVILICLPPTVLDDITLTWYMGRYMCKIVKYLQGVSVSVSVLTLSCISIERWYAICHPLKFKSTPSRARLIIGLTWMVALCLLVPELVVLDTQPMYPGVTVLMTSCKPMRWSPSDQEAYQLFISIGLFLCPLLLMFVTYAQIARCLWSNVIPTETTGVYRTVPTSLGGSSGSKSAPRGAPSKRKGRDQLHPSSANVNAEMQLQSRRKAAKMLIAVVIMFGICYLPVHLLNILRYAGALKDAAPEVKYFALIAHWLCYFNSAINPVIYNFMSAKFRKEFRKACACCCLCCFPGDRYRHQGGPAQTYAYRYSNTLATNLANMDRDPKLSRGGATRITNC